MTFDDYREMVEYVSEHGCPRPSRYGNTREVVGLQLTQPAGILVARKNLNRKIGWVEVVQLLAGEFDISAFAAVAPKARLDLFTPGMAYGPRLGAQLYVACELLREDPNSRQAVIFIGKPGDGMSSQQPCTQTVQMLRSANRIDTIVSMRSWDLMKGCPYDLMMFGALNHAVARSLDISPGRLIVQAGSGHIYDEDSALLPRPPVGTFHLDDALPRDIYGIRLWAKSQLDPQDWTKGCPNGIIVEAYEYR